MALLCSKITVWTHTRIWWEQYTMPEIPGNWCLTTINIRKANGHTTNIAWSSQTFTLRSPFCVIASPLNAAFSTESIIINPPRWHILITSSFIWKIQLFSNNLHWFQTFEDFNSDPLWAYLNNKPFLLQSWFFYYQDLFPAFLWIIVPFSAKHWFQSNLSEIPCFIYNSPGSKADSLC